MSVKEINITNSLELCKKESTHIMNDISDILKNHDLNFSHNASGTEIKVDVSSKDIDVEKIIRNELSVPNFIILLLLDIVALPSYTVIRLKRQDR